MSQKALSLPRQNPFRRFIHPIQERSKETEDGDPQDGPVVASPIVSATPPESTAGSLMTARDASQPAQFSLVPATIELRSPKQVTSSPSASYVKQPATTVSRVRTTHLLPTTHPLITQPDPVTCRVGFIGKTRPNPLGILGRVRQVFVGYPLSLLIFKAKFTWSLRLEAAQIEVLTQSKQL